MKNKQIKYLDKEEEELIKAIESGPVSSLPPEKEEEILQILQQAVENTLKKKKTINIRITEAELRKIKTVAIKEGVSY